MTVHLYLVEEVGALGEFWSQRVLAPMYVERSGERFGEEGVKVENLVE